MIPDLTEARAAEGGRVAPPIDAREDIPAITEPVMVDLDPDMEIPAASEAAKTGWVKNEEGPPAPPEPEMERTPPSAREGEAAMTAAGAVAEAANEDLAEPGSLSPPTIRASIRRAIEKVLRQPPWPAPRLLSLEDAGEVVHLLLKLRSPRINVQTERQTTAVVFDMTFVSVLQGRTDRLKGQCRELTKKLTRQQVEAKARKDDLGGKLKEAESRAEIVCSRASTAKTKLTLVLARLQSTEASMEELVHQLKHMEDWANAATDETRATVERTVVAEMAAVEAGYGQAEAVAQAQDARARAEEAESRAWEAKAQAREAEAQADNAVAEFRGSSKFEKEVIEASIDAYAKGFDRCKVKMSEVFGISNSDLEAIQPGDLDGEESEDDAARGESGPSRP